MRNTHSIVLMSDEGEPRAPSALIAEGMGQQHKSVLQLIKDNHADLSDFGFVVFKTTYSGRRGRPSEHALLNEQQAAFLISLMRNSDEVKQFKKRLIQEFYRMRESLARRDVGAMRRYFEAELRDKESFAKAQFGSELMNTRRREKPALKAELQQRLADAQPGLFLN